MVDKVVPYPSGGGRRVQTEMHLNCGTARAGGERGVSPRSAQPQGQSCQGASMRPLRPPSLASSWMGPSVMAWLTAFSMS